MKIVSRFRDYYDGLRSLDREDEPLFVREPRDLDWNELSVSERRALRDAIAPLWTDANVPPDAGWVDVERAVIGFCGRAYPSYRFAGTVARDVEEVIGLVRGVASAADIESLENRELRGRGRWQNRALSRATWARFLRERQTDVGDAPFLALGAPIVVVTDAGLHVNARLQDWGFGAHVDAYTAWQELSMYLGNNLAAARAHEPRPITDALKAHTHGFDAQSFRNQKNRPKSDRGDW